MRAEPTRTARRIAVALFISGLGGCSSSPTAEEATVMPNFEGTYSLSGSYDGRTGDSGIRGEVVVSEQLDGTATVTASLKVRDNGNTSFALNADDPYGGATTGPGVGQLEMDGSFRVSFSGREVIDGIDPASCCDARFEFNGRLSGDIISGQWSLTRDMPSYDSGTFLASR